MCARVCDLQTSELPITLIDSVESMWLLIYLNEQVWHTHVNVWQVSDLEDEVSRLTAELHADECDGEQNGAVTANDLDELQKVNKDMEQQLAEKNKVRDEIIKIQQAETFGFFKICFVCQNYEYTINV